MPMLFDNSPDPLCAVNLERLLRFSDQLPTILLETMSLNFYLIDKIRFQIANSSDTGILYTYTCLLFGPSRCFLRNLNIQILPAILAALLTLYMHPLFHIFSRIPFDLKDIAYPEIIKLYLGGVNGIPRFLYTDRSSRDS